MRHEKALAYGRLKSAFSYIIDYLRAVPSRISTSCPKSDLALPDSLDYKMSQASGKPIPINPDSGREPDALDKILREEPGKMGYLR